MRFGTITRWAARTTWLACFLVQVLPALGDEPSRFGRLFRFGSANDPSKNSTLGLPTPSDPAAAPTLGAGSGLAPGGTSTAASRSIADIYGQPALSTPTTTAPGSNPLTPTPRITPKPRVNKPATEADPLVSRISIGRADGGSQFGMFMQVFADGTVIDGEGVHKVSPEILKPVVEAVSSGDFAKIKGHCGGPAGDTFENIHVVTYERAYGRLRANAFSYSGNPQGCDHIVHHLHKVLDELQMKMTTPGANNAAPTPVGNPALAAPALAPNVTFAPVPLSPSSHLAMPTLPDPGLH